ncbi:anhydro-N-acetylmuramic acid kinase [Catalinimonas alkaloidigena]|uniref:Anhydro-N-acetylmuramic acid kinase n=1 Tax=Catalinimonas alkaloidigena TaxID=1075417 RepID=A0A1G9DPC1_9BACT|nr:anhydro-N-acetylmuramic acid kinase [Catalinimonas alkaloidigena]SDK65711.1 anhydro-N-acetylmuramic acid kinase [Catalinimonas alkaloidigena]
MKSYRVIGVMSGTSLDGLDIAFCLFEKKGSTWEFYIDVAETIPYGIKWRERLLQLPQANALTFCQAHRDFGNFAGEQIRYFMQRHRVEADFIASHGHTIFHQPDTELTAQIGHGAALYASTGLPVICDFRSVDVALGGQGAPLVPIGDQLLFQDYGGCLNLGGIANLSFDRNGKRMAYDICPVNIVFNELAEALGEKYDEGGQIAASGSIDASLLRKLDNLEFYLRGFPKSLGREWIEEQVFPLLQESGLSWADQMATFSRHVAGQIASAIAQWVDDPEPRVLVTGGGAFNAYLLSQIEMELQGKVQLVVPDDKLVSFKEALVFAFLGVLRARNEANCLASVTGASVDNIGGAVYGPLPY